VRVPTSARAKLPGLSPARLVEVALRIIDESGVDDLTMKRLARELGCSPMAAYKHVRDKDALLVLAADALVGRYLRASRRSATWEQEVRRHVRRSLELSARHPWASEALLRAYGVRDIDTPNVGAARAELEHTLRTAGFDPRAARLAQSLIETVITGLTVTTSYRARGLWRGSAGSDTATNGRAEPSARAHETFATDALLSALSSIRPPSA
jgi:AcrR family transcriptional regulator